jgi:hypothetical protein
MWLRYKQHIKNHVPTYSIVIFVLSAQNDCFLLAHENEFLVETVRSRQCCQIGGFPPKNGGFLERWGKFWGV